ncbi:MAG: hypothetical protein K8L91_27935 [Anaerolineae bacterium]|nr:hypothetical protein [Anaerolineae bacterium]
MPVCINCGSDKVERQGDAFTCHKCQFQWDVAFEQANKVYLRAQGRQPATSVLENPVKAEGGTLTALGQTDGAAVSTAPVATAAQPAGADQTSDAAATSPAVQSAVATPAHPPSESVGGDAGSAGAPEPPNTPTPGVQPPSTPKGKKG